MEKEPKICFLSGLPIGKSDFSIEHYCPKSRVPAAFANAKENKFPAIKIINFVKGNLLPCEWHVLCTEKLQYALENWHLKPRNRQIIIQTLDRLATEKDTLNPCQYCVLSAAPEQCYESRNMAGYRISQLSSIKSR